MTPPPAMSESILAAVSLIVAVRAGIRLWLAATRNKRRQAADILAAFMTALVRLRIGLLLLLLLTLLLLMLLLLMLLLLRTILHLLVTWRERLRVTRQVGLLLWLPRPVARLVLTQEGLIVVVVAVEGVVATLRLPARSALLMRLLIVIGVLLTKLLLRRRDQPEIVLRMLIIILGGYRIAGSLGVARQLDIFLGNVRGGAADFDVGTV
jgi:hypothetical protein